MFTALAEDSSSNLTLDSLKNYVLCNYFKSSANLAWDYFFSSIGHKEDTDLKETNPVLTLGSYTSVQDNAWLIQYENPV